MRKNNKIMVICVVIAALVIGTGAFLYIKFSQVNPEKIYEDTMTKYAMKYKKFVEKSKNNFNGTFNISFKDSDYQASANIKYGFDYERQKQTINISSKLNNKDLLSGNIYLGNNRAYFKIDNILDNYYYLELKDYEPYVEQSMPSDLYDAINSGINVLKSTLTSDYYSYVNDKDDKKIIFKVTEDKYVDLVKTYITNLINNQEFVNNVSKVTNKPNSIVREELTKLLDEDYTPVNLVVTTTIKKNKANKVVIEITNSTIKEVATIDIINDETSNINIDSNGTNTKMTLTVKDDNLLLNANSGNTSVNISNNITFGKTLEEPNITNAKDIETITESEVDNILFKIMNNDIFKDIMNSMNEVTYEQ